MMERLRDLEDSAPRDPLLAWASSLLREVPPLAPSAARQARVRATLAAEHGGGLWALHLRPVLVVIGVAGMVVAASAMLGRFPGRRPAPFAPVSVPMSAVPAGPIVSREAAPRIAPQPAGESQPAAPTRRHAAPKQAASHAPEGSANAVVRPETATAPASEESAAALVLSAARALRKDHDPERAAVLLADYLHRYPDGALAEEALALAIEAALERGDEQGATLASQYLSRYPSGRFQEVANRALQRLGD